MLTTKFSILALLACTLSDAAAMVTPRAGNGGGNGGGGSGAGSGGVATNNGGGGGGGSGVTTNNGGGNPGGLNGGSGGGDLGNSVCAQWCKTYFPTDAGSACTSLAAKGQGPCYTCGPRKTNEWMQPCHEACVDTSSDANNCGKCDNHCPFAVCKVGICQGPACGGVSFGIKYSDGNFGQVSSTSSNGKLQSGSSPSSVSLNSECELIYNDNGYKANQDAGARLEPIFFNSADTVSGAGSPTVHCQSGPAPDYTLTCSVGGNTHLQSCCAAAVFGNYDDSSCAPLSFSATPLAPAA